MKTKGEKPEIVVGGVGRPWDAPAWQAPLRNWYLYVTFGITGLVAIAAILNGLAG